MASLLAFCGPCRGLNSESELTVPRAPLSRRVARNMGQARVASSSVLRPSCDWYPRRAAPGSEPVPRPLLTASLLRLVPGDARGNVPPIALREPCGKELVLTLTENTASGKGREIAVCAGVDGTLRSDFWLDFVGGASAPASQFFVRVYCDAEILDSDGNVDLTNADLLGSGWLTRCRFENQSRGVVTCPIVQSTDVGGLLGDATFEFLHVTSFASEQVKGDPVMMKPPQFIGHRGCGGCTKHVLENTMGSFKFATQSDAEAPVVKFVELDVQMSSDKVPVIFHDFSFSTLSGHKLYMYNLTAKEIAALQHKTPANAQPVSDYQIPTLSTVASDLPSDAGILVEIKYPPPNVQQSEHIPYPDANLLVDRTLQSLLVENDNPNREIAILSFDADICTMFALKQTKFPVFFLHCEQRDGDECDDADPRTVSVERGVDYAESQNFAGMVLFSEMVLEDESLATRVRSRGMSVLSYGEHNTEPDLVKHQIQDLGVHGVIADNVISVAEAVSCML